MKNKIAEALERHGAILFGDFVLASGARSSYYLDVKSAMTDPALLGLVCREIAETFRPEMVAGVAVGGVPLAVGVALEGTIPYAIIRSSEKDHGKSGRIIGEVRGRNVLLVEDVTTSGGSALYGVHSLRDAGAIIHDVVCVVDREQGASRALASDGITLHALVRAAELTKE